MGDFVTHCGTSYQPWSMIIGSIQIASLCQTRTHSNCHFLSFETRVPQNLWCFIILHPLVFCHYGYPPLFQTRMAHDGS